MQDKRVEIRDTYLRNGETQIDKCSVATQTPTTAAPTSRLTLLGLWRIVGGAMMEGENVEVEKRGKLGE